VISRSFRQTSSDFRVIDEGHILKLETVFGLQVEFDGNRTAVVKFDHHSLAHLSGMCSFSRGNGIRLNDGSAELLEDWRVEDINDIG